MSPATANSLRASGPDTDIAPDFRLAVRRLTLTNFRSYESLRLSFDDRPVVLAGANGAGKTNLLEAISFLAPGRGLRRARLSEAARRDTEGNGWAVAATLSTPVGPVEIGTGLEAQQAEDGRPERRTIRIDGTPARGQAALGATVAIAWLTPEMDRLFVDSASDRRRFLDRIVGAFDPNHASRAAAYETAMRQRLRLLREGRADAKWLAALETSMAEKGIAIAAARRQVVERLDQACAIGIGPFPKAGLAIAGTVEESLNDGPALAAEDALRDRLAATRANDAEAGRTTEGPHRSNLQVRYLPKDLPAAAVSTGEQKAMLIAIILATVRLLALDRGAAPLVLMDEVAAHLDQDRRAALFAELGVLGAQAWLTGTDASMFAGFGDDAQFLHVENGRISNGSAKNG